ncbi:DUF2474 family protein [Acinetobacter gerneri]|jgi:hypothetical protein|uniref:DUF2474 domain-containing protein n=2 Tax=Acinetobacter gerneri TaxID=202952 RepID=N8Y8L8_9GAMM|nr:DUF2474 family protein [Acinetobacter gerneri]ENV33087.1 hypothetical protein F960_02809 [Acinetobacter gerneri DSM 14967 = CIP 107464 = MTCC 9824]MCH4242644.1 DUF2474 family protein [Acinetobacter gerneri]MDQ9009576.1 DUF2474 family protein [Acinetobacter gerneri]MDQ9013828.1 DUF2474 family protein [Acinetobacter gerneri]MDQ9024996.1 DUF2474 family protein [Acinetobacter gerneri]
MKISQTGWFILLWLGGVLTLAIIAGFFRMLIQLAYQ